jgi:hypothetical protein
VNGPQFKKAIEEAWLDVRKECVEQGHSRFMDKNAAQLRNDLWMKKKTEVAARYDKWKKTGKGSHREWLKVCICILFGLKSKLKLLFSGKKLFCVC